MKWLALARQELRMTEQELRSEIEDLQAELAQRKGGKGPGNSRMSMAPGADKRMSVYAGRGPAGGDASGGSDVVQMRRDLQQAEGKLGDEKKAREKLERQAEHLKTELSNMKEELVATKKDARSKGSKLAASEKAKEEADKELEKLRSKAAAADEKAKGLAAEKSQVAAEKGASEREGRVLFGKVEALTKDVERLRGENKRMKEVQAACAAAEKKSEGACSEAERLKLLSDEATAEVRHSS